MRDNINLLPGSLTFAYVSYMASVDAAIFNGTIPQHPPINGSTRRHTTSCHLKEDIRTEICALPVVDVVLNVHSGSNLSVGMVAANTSNIPKSG